MTTPTTPSPERQPADAGGELWSVGSWLSAALDDPKVCPEMKRDIQEWFDGNGHVRAPAPQAQPDARAVEGLPTGYLSRGDSGEFYEHTATEPAHYPDEGGDFIPLYTRKALSAPAADDGWRPSREEVAKRVYEAMRWAARHAEDKPAPEWVEGGNSDAQYQARREADRILALHPAAPTDEVGK